MLLRPGMTATAEIVTTEKRDVLLVPNAALALVARTRAAAARDQGGGVTSVLMPRRPRGTAAGASARSPSAAAAPDRLCARGGRRTHAGQVTIGESNGSETEVIGKGIADGPRSSPVSCGGREPARGGRSVAWSLTRGPVDVAPTATIAAPGKTPLIRLRGVTKTYGRAQPRSRR